MYSYEFCFRCIIIPALSLSLAICYFCRGPIAKILSNVFSFALPSTRSDSCHALLPCPHVLSDSEFPRLETRSVNSTSKVTSIKNTIGFFSVNDAECGSSVTNGSGYQPLPLGAPWSFLDQVIDDSGHEGTFLKT